jgi:2-phospho-L-lactate guanylyltransferase (CobY/MobA/RfbA family)
MKKLKRLMLIGVKAIDQMKSKLAQEDDPESRQKILNATLDNVVEMAEKDRSTLVRRY